jgi:hypothetical protein
VFELALGRHIGDLCCDGTIFALVCQLACWDLLANTGFTCSLTNGCSDLQSSSFVSVGSAASEEQAMEQQVTTPMALGIDSSFGFGGFTKKPQKSLASIISTQYCLIWCQNIKRLATLLSHEVCDHR